MATWFTHYRIANILADKHQTLDRNAFILGNLAPDSGLLISDLVYNPSSNISHYTTNSDKAKIMVNQLLSDYLFKVKNLKEYSFLMGYYIHLITDKIYSNLVFKELIESNHITDLKGKELAHARKEWHQADALIYNDLKNEIIKDLNSLDFSASIVEHFSDEHYHDMIKRRIDEMNHVPNVDYLYTTALDNTNFIKTCIDQLDDILVSWIKPIKTYDTLFIDLDNTIFDFEKAEDRSLRNTFNKFGVDASRENMDIYIRINKELWHQLEENLITKDELFWKRFELALEAMGESYKDPKAMANEYAHQLSMSMDYFEGVEETLFALKKEYQIDLITNGILSIQTPRIQNSSLKDCLDHIFISEQMGYSKPNIEYFKTALNLAEVKDKSKVLVVGDALSSDIKGASNAKLDCVWITNMINTTKLKHELIIDNLSILRLWLKRPNYFSNN